MKTTGTFIPCQWEDKQVHTPWENIREFLFKAIVLIPLLVIYPLSTKGSIGNIQSSFISQNLETVQKPNNIMEK